MNLFLLGRAALTGALILIAAGTHAQAATLTVSNLNDSGVGSLRQAVASANATAAADTIVFASSMEGTLALKTGQLTINNDVSLVGPGADTLAISGGGMTRLLTITKGTVAISGLTFANGFARGKDGKAGTLEKLKPIPATSGEDAFGGAIFNQGALTLTDSSLHDNMAQGGRGGLGGGGGMNYPGPAGLGGVARGGAIFNGGTLKIVHTLFKNNTAQGGDGGKGGLHRWDMARGGPGGQGGAAYGGAVYGLGSLGEDCIFRENRAIGGAGGEGGSSGGTPGAPGSYYGGDVFDATPQTQNASFSGMVSVPFKEQLPATGDTLTTYSLVSGRLPTGLNLNPQTGVIAGTPTKAIVGQQVTFKVSNPFAESAVATATFSIQPYTPETKSLIVTTLNDTVNAVDNLTSLREAIAYAHTLAGSPTIRFQEGLQGAFTVGGDILRLNHDLSIIGPTKGAVTLIDGRGWGLFHVQKGRSALFNLTLSQGSENLIVNESGATLVLSNCAVLNCEGMGAALYNQSGGTVVINNCTFANNNVYRGGAIYNEGQLTIDSSTIANNNSSFGPVGGIHNAGNLTLRNSIVVGNTASEQGADIYGQVQGGDYNLVQKLSDAILLGSHNITGKAAKLGALKNNGGPTPTLALLPGSLALNTGRTALKTDQCGSLRPAGSAADIGAYEDQSSVPVLSVTAPSVREGNGGTATPAQLLFTLTLSKASSQSVSVVVQTNNASTAPATANNDYLVLGRTRVTFAPGQTRQTVALTIVGDANCEENERVALLLSSPSGINLAAPSAEGTIINDDPVPSLSINDVSVQEGNSAYSNAVFTVTLSNASDRTINVGYATYSSGRGAAIGGTVTTAGVDYIAIAPTTLSFAPGQTSKTLTVLLKGDTLMEGNELFLVRLSAPINARLADGSSLGTIFDDDSVSNRSTAPSGGNS